MSRPFVSDLLFFWSTRTEQQTGGVDFTMRSLKIGRAGPIDHLPFEGPFEGRISPAGANADATSTVPSAEALVALVRPGWTEIENKPEMTKQEGEATMKAITLCGTSP
jgi:hypothetical protein